MTLAGPALERLRQPEYTGENRCLPCTAVNVVIAAVLSVGVGVAVALTVSASAGVAAGLLSLGSALCLIYLRGYLVPKTPELTKRCFPPWLLSAFGKDAPAAAAVTEIDPERELIEAGALEACAERDDLCLTEPFRARWEEELARIREEDSGRERLLELLDVDRKTVEFKEHGRAFRAYVDGRRVGTWESEAAYLADLAAANALSVSHPRWDDLALVAKSQLLSGLRLFVENCPSCGGQPTFDTDTVESCCSCHEVAAVSCTECGARLFETRV